jgi:uncharacterized membrane protein YeiH
LIFKKEIYASACLIGGVVYLSLGFLDVSENIQFVLSGLVIFVIRLVAVKYKLELPKINNDIFGK